MNTIDELLRDKEIAENKINAILKELFEKYKSDIKNADINIGFSRFKENYERDYNININTEISITL